MKQISKLLEVNNIAEVELVYKTKVKASDRPKIICAFDAFEVLRCKWDLGKIELQEQFKVLLLNRGNKLLGIIEVSTGGISGTVADPKLIFVAALKAAASSIILCHNHPSGTLTPSLADKTLTKQAQDAGSFLGITVVDHLIITSSAYFSFAEEGLL